MGDLPLRTPTHRRLGGPLPRQQANGTHPHPLPINLYLSLPCGKTNTSGIKLPFRRLSRSKGQVGYALLTRAPVAIKPSKAGSMLPLDLHVLSLSLAFILSQDQTLHCRISLTFTHKGKASVLFPDSLNLPVFLVSFHTPVYGQHTRES